MWPWAHLALGYLSYTLYLRLAGAGRPLGGPVFALAVGTLLPDLIDKPLAWYVHVLPYGRSFAHSLLTGGLFVLGPLVFLLVWRGYHEIAVAFAVGYLSHMVGDGYTAVLHGEWGDLAFLVWPLLPPPPTEVVGLSAHLADIRGSPEFLFGLGLTIVAGGVWLRHGTPGLVTLRTWITRAPRSE